MIETLEQRLEATGLLDEVLIHTVDTVKRSATSAYIIGRRSGYTDGYTDGYRDGAEMGFKAGDEHGFVNAATEFTHRGD